ncbi:MAG: 2-hydroxyacyl-CoA dehydratase, partial [Sphingomonadales bacterium]
LYVDQFKGLIRFLEAETGKRFDETAFRRVMGLVDEQENYYRMTRDLIASARPTPLNIVDQLPATVIPQWHRGTEWARDRAKLFYERTKALVETGHAAVPGERARLMWLGIGLWHNLRFYQHFEQEHGAVFAWNEYLALGADGYRVAAAADPLRTLAGRMCNVMSVVAQDRWYNEQYLQAGLDGVVIMEGGASREEGGGCNTAFGRAHRTRDIFERAGVPVCVINADPVNAAGFDEPALQATISEFLVTEVLPRTANGAS